MVSKGPKNVWSSQTYLHHLLVLQFHVGRPVVDHTDHFLEGDALQRSLLPRRHLTGIVGGSPPLLYTHTQGHRKHRQLEGDGKKEQSLKTQTHTALHCSSAAKPLQQQGEQQELLPPEGSAAHQTCFFSLRKKIRRLEDFLIS